MLTFKNSNTILERAVFPVIFLMSLWFQQAVVYHILSFDNKEITTTTTTVSMISGLATQAIHYHAGHPSQQEGYRSRLGLGYR